MTAKRREMTEDERDAQFQADAAARGYASGPQDGLREQGLAAFYGERCERPYGQGSKPAVCGCGGQAVIGEHFADCASLA